MKKGRVVKMNELHQDETGYRHGTKADRKKAPPKKRAPAPPAPQAQPDVMNIEQAAAYLQVSESTMRRMLREKTIPAGKVQGQWRFSRRQLVGWIEAQSAIDTTTQDFTTPGVTVRPPVPPEKRMYEFGEIPPTDQDRPVDFNHPAPTVPPPPPDFTPPTQRKK